MLTGSAHVAYEAFVRHAAPGAHGRGSVVWACARRLTAVQVRHQRDVALIGKAAGYLLGAPVVTGHVVDDDNSPERPVPQGLRQVRLDLVTAVAGDGDRFSFHVVAHAGEAIVG